MSEIIKNYQQQVEPENPRSEKLFKTALKIAAALIVVAAAVFFIKGGFDRGASSRPEVTVSGETSVPADQINILGEYMVRLTSPQDTSRLSGYIEMDELGQISLHILSAYEPRVYPITINPDGTLFNYELGHGEMSFKKLSEQTVITFLNDNSKCVLIK